MSSCLTKILKYYIRGDVYSLLVTGRRLIQAILNQTLHIKQQKKRSNAKNLCKALIRIQNRRRRQLQWPPFHSPSFPFSVVSASS